jgi:hypothetical protein
MPESLAKNPDGRKHKTIEETKKQPGAELNEATLDLEAMTSADLL